MSYEVNAIVVFEDRPDNDLAWFHYLLTTKGCRHVRVLVRDDVGWCEINPLAGVITVRMVAAGMDNPPVETYRQVHDVADYRWHSQSNVHRLRIPWGITIWSCVEVVKAVLGIRRPWIITPRQLERYIGRTIVKHTATQRRRARALGDESRGATTPRD